MKITGQDWIKQLDLAKHPEGGYYKETYRSSDLVNQDQTLKRYQGDRNASTAIYYLLMNDDISVFHKLQSDEIFHFYSGSPLDVHIIDPQGKYYYYKLGNNPLENQLLQLVIPHGSWFASGVSAPNSYSLIGCTVSPGFDFSDFSMASQQELIQLFPEHQAVIEKYTHNN